jgi:predicted RNA binding protein YcfA (HicA-like mRNA interferase family)
MKQDTPTRKVREGWEEAAKEMARLGEDRIPDWEDLPPTEWDLTEWQWDFDDEPDEASLQQPGVLFPPWISPIALSTTGQALPPLDITCRLRYNEDVKVKDVIKMVEADGWRLDRQKGSHRQYVHPSKPGIVTIPGDPAKEMAAGTLNNIKKQAGIK